MAGKAAPSIPGKTGIRNPLWLFVPLGATGGICYWGIVALLMPYLLRKHGVAVDRIAEISATASIPTVWYFLWSPVVDLGLRRRTWFIASSGIAAVCFGMAVLESSRSLPVLTVLLFAGTAVSTVAGAALGAILASVPEEFRGRASGCSQMGNIGAGALAGGACISLADTLGSTGLALAVAAIVFLPALAAYRIVEVPRLRLPAMQLVSALSRDIRDVLWSWRTLVGLVFFCSPVGSGALTNLISGVAPDFHAPTSEVAWVTGLGGGLLLAVGSFSGGFLCDRMDRRTAYALFGLLAAVASGWMALGALAPLTYGAGYACYALSTGFSYAAFNALVLDVLGHGRRAAATGFALLGSCGYLPVTYMTWLDGVGYKHSGARGLMGVDAIANGAGGVALLLLAYYSSRRWNKIRLQSAAA
jgi:MFS transporter, PAT family, beta-lactamase induction signal transducer AmpG